MKNLILAGLLSACSTSNEESIVEKYPLAVYVKDSFNNSYEVDLRCEIGSNIESCLRDGEVVALCEDSDYPHTKGETWNAVWGKEYCANNLGRKKEELTLERKEFAKYAIKSWEKTYEIK